MPHAMLHDDRRCVLRFVGAIRDALDTVLDLVDHAVGVVSRSFDQLLAGEPVIRLRRQRMLDIARRQIEQDNRLLHQQGDP